MTGDAWRDDALCADPRLDPELWYSDHPKSQDEAIEICNDCPVRAQCLEYAVTTERTSRVGAFGIWGATRPEERHHIRRHRTKAATP